MFKSHTLRPTQFIGRISLFLMLLGLTVMGLPDFAGAQQTCHADGDVDQNGSITAADALLAFQHALSINVLNACQRAIANVFSQPNTSDSPITASDALCIFQKALGLPSCLDMLPSKVLNLSEGSWVTYYESGPFTIQPGAFYSRGLVILGCPDGGAPCTVTVGENQVATYDSAGGVPFVAATMPEDPLDHPWKIGAGEVPYRLIGDIPIVATHDDIEVRYGVAEEGVGLDYLAAYLLDESYDNSEPGKVDRFGIKPPTVRVVQGATAEMIADTAMLVQEINSHLPSTWQLQFSNVPAASIDEHSPLEIVVAFPSDDDWQFPAGTQGHARVRKGFDSQDSSVHPIEGARVWVKGSYWTTEVAGLDMRRLGRLYLAHEMLHALGRHHPNINGEFFNATVMGNPFTATSENESDSFLSPLDKEALRAVYTKFSPTDNAAEAAEILGDDWMRSIHLWGYVGLRVWTDVIERAGGGVEYLDFGVSLQDGSIDPWVVSGMLPWANLADNPALSGSASWNGLLLGLTPAAEVVTGEASLGIGLSSLSGTLDFTSLESWGSRQSPGQIGNGSVWGDGSLNYDVSVTGNTFVQVDSMNGDAGDVTGAFYGTQHEAFGGILERDDLSAAFGGLQDTVCFVDSARASVMPCN